MLDMTLLIHPRRLPCWLGLVSIFVAGCTAEPQPITAKSSKYEVAEDSVSSGASDPADISVAGDDFMANSRAPASSSVSSSGESNAASEDSPSSREPSQGGSSQNAPPRKPSSTPPRGVAKRAVDESNPESILAHLNDLQSRLTQGQIGGATQQERMTNAVNLLEEMNRLADKVLVSDTEDRFKIDAAQIKVQVLMGMQQMGDPDAKEDLRQFLATIAKSESAEFKRFARNVAFALDMDAFASNPRGDAKRLLKDFETLFAEEKKDEALMQLGRQVSSLFTALGKSEEAIRVMNLMQESFSSSDDPQLVAQAQAIGNQIKVLELDINSKFEALLKGDPDSEKPLLDAMTELMADKETQAQAIAITLEVAQNVEAIQFDSASRFYELLKSGLSNISDEETRKAVESALDDFDKRKALIGEPIDVEGLTLKGEPFDWSQYKGKIVLLDFWATWCEPCLRELPNIRENYEKYHDQGFEVVGVNLDEDRRSVDAFFSLQKLPWTTIVSPDPNKTGFDNPLSQKLNVKAIPFIVLVGRDGKVITLNTRGENLGKKLAELFAEKPEKGSSS